MSVVSTPDAVRTGVCVVRAEVEAPARVRITITTCPDIGRPSTERVTRTANVDDALAQIGDFLDAVAGGSS